MKVTHLSIPWSQGRRHRAPGTLTAFPHKAFVKALETVGLSRSPGEGRGKAHKSIAEHD